MPPFVVYCLDKADALQARLANRPEHIAYLDAQGEAVRIAGPLLSEAGEMIGSLLIVDLPDLAAAQAFQANDPFTKAGVFERVEVRPWKISIGELP